MGLRLWTGLCLWISYLLTVEFGIRALRTRGDGDEDTGLLPKMEDQVKLRCAAGVITLDRESVTAERRRYMVGIDGQRRRGGLEELKIINASFSLHVSRGRTRPFREGCCFGEKIIIEFMACQSITNTSRTSLSLMNTSIGGSRIGTYIEPKNNGYHLFPISSSFLYKTIFCSMN